MQVTISDQAKAIVALEKERAKLFARSAAISKEQDHVLEVFKAKMKQLGRRQRGVIAQIDAMDYALSKLLQER